MAINRHEEVKALTDAGFVLKRRNAKTLTYECMGIQVTIGAGSAGTAHSMAEVRSAIRKAESAKSDADLYRNLDYVRKLFDEVEETGDFVPCAFCKSEKTEIVFELQSLEHLYQHVRDFHKKTWRMLEQNPQHWRRLGLDPDTGKKIKRVVVRKDRDFWLRRTEDLVAKEGVSHARDVIAKLNDEGYRSGSGKRMDAFRFWPWFDEVNRYREARGDRPLIVQGERVARLVSKISGGPTPEPVPEPAQETVTETIVSQEVIQVSTATAMKGVPAYIQMIMEDSAIPVDRKAAAVKALAPKLPTSVTMMLEDPDLTQEQRLRILAIAMEEK